MPLHTVFEPSTLSSFAPLQTAQVVGVSDPLGLGRVQVRLLSCDGFDSQDSQIWARVAVPFAGADYGAFLLPGIDDEVVVAFLNGDPRFPIVVGSLWHGAAKPTETLPDDEVDRWTFTGKQGSRIAIVETSKSDAEISFTVPGGISGTLTASGGGKIEFKSPQATITMDTAGVAVRSKSKVHVTGASDVTVTAPQVHVNSASSTFSGKITCASIETGSITSAAYSIGAGNVW